MSTIFAKCPYCGTEMKLDSSWEKFICGSCQVQALSEAAICYYNYKHNRVATAIPVAQVSQALSNSADFEVVAGKLVKYKGSAADVVIPDGLCTIIGYRAFYRTSITSVHIPDSVREIEYEVFYHCEYLKSVRLPKNLSTIGSNAFSYCTRLVLTEIPASVTKIGDFAFSGCTSLRSIKISNPAVEIGSYPFMGCDELGAIDYLRIDDNVIHGTKIHREQAEKANKEWQQSMEWKRNYKCAYCGGAFKGFFTLTCSKCGKEKSY